MQLTILFAVCSSIICALLLQVNQTTAAAASATVTFKYGTTIDFRAQTDKALTTTVKPEPVGYSVAQYIGCFEEKRNAEGVGGEELRVMSHEVTRDGTDIQACINACRAAGYTFAAGQYGAECWCGHDYHNKVSTECTMPCSGNNAEMCGSGYVNSLYSVCKKGFYGKDCKSVCSSCTARGCHITTGQCLTETNWALNKPAWQSTQISGAHPASKAVNGVKTQYITATSEADKDCSHTAAGSTGALSWWAVDLSQIIKVSHVVITGRSDGLVPGLQSSPERLKNFYIGVTNVAPNVTAPVPCSSSLCGLVGPAPSGPTYSVDVTCLSDTAAGRYLVVQFATTSNFLTLCEVEVYGSPA